MKPSCIRVVLIVASILFLPATPSLAAYKGAAPAGVDLTGHWKINAALSDDAEALLQERLADERKQREKWLRRAREIDPLGIPPIGMPLPPPPSEDAEQQPTPPPQPQMQRARNRFVDELRRMLNISDTMSITQAGTKIDIVSAVDARRFDAGTQSQVSMPQGALADSDVGWDGQWFVIERRARGGPRVTEKYRWLKKTDQIESVLAWGGDTILSGIKVRRIYDRMSAPPPAPDPESGPIR
ncbi:hypothetical protein HNQ60_001412 [Povalibacter uvarum]|uniref:Uncharacterized protein n=1 Tax=Povalibacter uvarum TaxID=732238 RepID=A0A841HIX6_9GAMM|nr:hypothetical protein [Povalibacter uvarum]MBB6092534.1 hypothetical protein [Povalibacter uvarum]